MMCRMYSSIRPCERSSVSKLIWDGYIFGYRLSAISVTWSSGLATKTRRHEEPKVRTRLLYQWYPAQAPRTQVAEAWATGYAIATHVRAQRAAPQNSKLKTQNYLFTIHHSFIPYSSSLPPGH